MAKVELNSTVVYEGVIYTPDSDLPDDVAEALKDHAALTTTDDAAGMGAPEQQNPMNEPKRAAQEDAEEPQSRRAKKAE